MYKANLIILSFIALCFLSGCATSRGEIELTIPEVANAASANGKTVYIQSVIDNRVFEQRPRQPNIPSLDPDEPQNDEIKLRAVARKRNTYGKGLGDIILKQGQTVQSLIADSLRQAFIKNGYRVIKDSQQLVSDYYIVDARIDKFWSWMNPGFWAISLNTEISTVIEMKSGDKIHRETVAVKVSDNFQTGAGSNWIEVMHKALEAYIAEAQRKLK